MKAGYESPVTVMFVSPTSVSPPLVTTLIVIQVSTPPPLSLDFWQYVVNVPKAFTDKSEFRSWFHHVLDV